MSYTSITTYLNIEYICKHENHIYKRIILLEKSLSHIYLCVYTKDVL